MLCSNKKEDHSVTVKLWEVQICHRLYSFRQWKNRERPLRFDEVTAMSLVASFLLELSCCSCDYYWCLYDEFLCLWRCQHSCSHTVWWHGTDVCVWEWTHRRGWSSAWSWCRVGKPDCLLTRLAWINMEDRMDKCYDQLGLHTLPRSIRHIGHRSSICRIWFPYQLAHYIPVTMLQTRVESCCDIHLTNSVLFLPASMILLNFHLLTTDPEICVFCFAVSLSSFVELLV